MSYIMRIANRTVCRELYDLSRWYFGDHKWHHSSFNDLWTLAPADDDIGKTYKVICPGYTLTYLLSRLPLHLGSKDLRLSYDSTGEGWWRAYYTDGDIEHEVVADTPEDAACKLAIKLFKAGILKREARP